MYLIGNTIVGFSQTFGFACPATIAHRYFSLKLETIILTAPTFIYMLGAAVGIWVPAMIMNDTLDHDTIV